MAIDPRISLIPAPTINLGQRFAQNLQNIEARERIEANQAAEPLRQQQIDFATNKESKLDQRQQQLQSIAINYATSLKPMLGNPDGLIMELQRQKALYEDAGIPTSGIDEDILQAQTPQGLQELSREVNDTLSLTGANQKSVSQREFESNIARVKADPKLETSEGKAAAIALGLEAKASSSATERIALDEDLANAVADTQAQIEGAREGAKLTKQLKFKPAITKAVKLAEKAATERGEVLTDLARAKAAMPGLEEVTTQLKGLADIATSTIGGRIMDFAVKESGFGSTKGATARAKFDAIVSNQVLPLLKPTFGAQFTVNEGEWLRSTLGDINASPAQKVAALDVFIQQKRRNIEAKDNQLQIDVSALDAAADFLGVERPNIETTTQTTQRTSGVIMEDANGNRALVFPDGTFEEQ